MSAQYQIKVKGQLDAKFSEWFRDFAISHTSHGDTLLTGTADQAALHGVLTRCRDPGITIISINPLAAAEAAKTFSKGREKSLELDTRRGFIDHRRTS